MHQANKEYGRLFVLEGPDGAGKTILAKALVEQLNSRGTLYEYAAFPGIQEGTLGNMVYDLHHEPERYGITSIHPLSLQTLHIAAHIDAIEQRILPALRSGQSMVLDRFWWSTWVYGLAAGV